MFNITYEIWKEITEMYCSIPTNIQTRCLQWFPFSKLSKEEIQELQSKGFYDKNIAHGSFVMHKRNMHCSNNFIQKSDSSFRDSKLVSPILYLVLQCIGKCINELFDCICQLKNVQKTSHFQSKIVQSQSRIISPAFNHLYYSFHSIS